ncbi:MAG: S8 family serine peptidase [Chloroflexi bacterium]|nr:S8 family serine peptidase [Chloroflexota bacterium]
MFTLIPDKRRVHLLSAVATLTVILAGLLLPDAATRPASALAETGPAPADLPYVPGEVLIGWEASSAGFAAAIRPAGLDSDRSSPAWQAAVQTLAAATGLVVLDAQPEYGTARLAVSPGQEAAEITRLTALPWVKYAEPNYIAHATATYPNDPFFSDQWNLRRIGAPEAWDVTTGSYSIVVAVLDSGVDLGHPEFAGRLLAGYDYVNNDNSPQDDFGHGTHVAGILAAAANNATGIAGLAPIVKILPLKVLDAGGSGGYDNIALAIRRAADSAVQVINLSLGGIYDSFTLRDAITYAAGRNVVLVTAAGNCAKSIALCNYQTNPTFYPAAYPEVIAVAASDHYDNWADYSGHKSYVALAAPGGAAADPVWSTLPGSYGFEYGTSMAAPLVSGAAVLALTISPTLTAGQVADALKATADKTGYNLQTSAALDYATGRNDYFGYGRLNVGRLARWVSPASLSAAPTHLAFLASPGSQKTATVTLTNPSGRPVSWQATVIDGATWLSATPAAGTTAYAATGTLTLRIAPAALAPGFYDGIVRVQYSGAASGGFNVYVRLQVTDAVHFNYAPLFPIRDLRADWIDPLAGGSPLNLTDNSQRQVSLPFPFYFYGQTYESLWVTDDGLAFFGQGGAGAISAVGACLPTAAWPNSAIYALWADWKPALGGQVYVSQPDADRYAVTWYQVQQTPAAAPQSFQIVLFRDGHLALQYLSVPSPPQGTIGLENYDGTYAVQLACGGAGRPVGSGDAVSLRPDLPW